MKYRVTIIILVLLTSIAFQLKDMGVWGAPAPATSDLTVTYTPIIAPTVTNNGATNVTDNDARLNGEIIDTGNEAPTVYVYYGLTDEGENPAAWTENRTVGIEGLGTFYYDVTDNLTFSSTTYFIFRAVNSEGVAWSATANLTTSSEIVTIQPPTDFTVTEAGVNSANLTWVTGANATSTYIRVSSTHYPISLTDGYELYSNNGTLYTHEGLTLDSSTYYYSAWGVASGEYSATYVTGQIGGSNMIFIGLFAFAGIMSFLSIRSRDNILIALAATAIWIFIFAYTRANPIPGVTVGSTVDTYLILGVWAVALALPIMSIQKMRGNKRLNAEGYMRGDDGSIVARRDSELRRKTPSMLEMSNDEYQATLNRRLRRNRRR